MEAFLTALHDRMWEIIETGDIVFTRTNSAINDNLSLPMTAQLSKPKGELDLEETKIVGLVA